MTKIFLCYRSGDDAYAATLLDEKLSGVVGRRNVFRASRSILPGDSYADAIMTAIETCDTMLVVIGPTWRERFDKSAQDDWVRIEISTAMRLGKRVVPVLLSQTSRLTAHELPQDISELARNTDLKFELRSIDTDLARLVNTLGLSGSRISEASQAVSPEDNHTEFAVRREMGWDGSVEFDVVQRSWDGVITGRLSGRAHPADLARMAALIAQPALSGTESDRLT